MSKGLCLVGLKPAPQPHKKNPKKLAFCPFFLLVFFFGLTSYFFHRIQISHFLLYLAYCRLRQREVTLVSKATEIYAAEIFGAVGCISARRCQFLCLDLSGVSSSVRLYVVRVVRPVFLCPNGPSFSMHLNMARLSALLEKNAYRNRFREERYSCLSLGSKFCLGFVKRNPLLP